MSQFTDAVIAYRIVSLLATPFKKTAAFRLGIIDDQGQPLKRASDLKTTAEKDAYTPLIRLVFRVKQLLRKIGLQDSAAIVAAFALVREHLEAKDFEVLDEEIDFIQPTAEDTQLVEEILSKYKGKYQSFSSLVEDGVVLSGPIGNTTANVQGLETEPVVRKRPRILRRKTK